MLCPNNFAYCLKIYCRHYETNIADGGECRWKPFATRINVVPKEGGKDAFVDGKGEEE